MIKKYFCDVIVQTLESRGIKVNGSNSWDLQIKNDRAYSEIALRGSLGLGESYMAGWVDCARVDEFIFRLLNHKSKQSWIERYHDNRILNRLTSKFLNRGDEASSFKKAGSHYNVGNDLYSRMLGERMMYSCAYWNKLGMSLEEAQEAKLDLICKKVGLDKKSGMKILDIGCGWGGFAQYAATKYGAHVTGVTVSKEQYKLAVERCKNLPVEIKLMDYRNLTGEFDAIISIGMFEHVGRQYYDTFFQTAKKLLKPGGLFLLHTIISDRTKGGFDQFLDKYIFPGAELPSVADMVNGTDGLFRLEDIHLLGSEHYEQTLMEWNKRFLASWPEIAKLGNYDETFKRMFSYYLLSCAGGFRARIIDVAQIVFSKDFDGRYRQVR